MILLQDLIWFPSRFTQSQRISDGTLSLENLSLDIFCFFVFHVLLYKVFFPYCSQFRDSCSSLFLQTLSLRSYLPHVCFSYNGLLLLPLDLVLACRNVRWQSFLTLSETCFPYDPQESYLTSHNKDLLGSPIG